MILYFFYNVKNAKNILNYQDKRLKIFDYVFLRNKSNILQ